MNDFVEFQGFSLHARRRAYRHSEGQCGAPCRRLRQARRTDRQTSCRCAAPATPGLRRTPACGNAVAVRAARSSASKAAPSRSDAGGDASSSSACHTARVFQRITMSRKAGCSRNPARFQSSGLSPARSPAPSASASALSKAERNAQSSAMPSRAMRVRRSRDTPGALWRATPAGFCHTSGCWRVRAYVPRQNGARLSEKRRARAPAPAPRRARAEEECDRPARSAWRAARSVRRPAGKRTHTGSAIGASCVSTTCVP